MRSDRSSILRWDRSCGPTGGPSILRHRSSLTDTYRQHEATKCRAYKQRVQEIEHGYFTPLVFSATGGMAPTATTAYKRLASLLADKRKQEYSKTICWLRCTISFSLVRSAVMCLRGARSSIHRSSRTVDYEVPLDKAICEGRIPSYTEYPLRHPICNISLLIINDIYIYFFKNAKSLFFTLHGVYCAIITML